MHNPLRSEREVFRAVVVIGLGACAVLALALLTLPVFGAVLLAAEVSLGNGVLWRGPLVTLPDRGEVGDQHEPNAALEDALRFFAADEVIISTHPPHKSRWLERGVVERARREVPLPVTHVVVDLESEATRTTGTAEPAA